MDRKDWYAVGVFFMFIFIGIALSMQASYECSLVRCDQPESLLPTLFMLAGILFAFAWTFRERIERKWNVQ